MVHVVRDAWLLLVIGFAVAVVAPAILAARSWARPHLIARLQCALIVAACAAAWTWEVVDPGGVGYATNADQRSFTGVPLHFDIPVTVVALLMPFHAFVAARALGRPRLGSIPLAAHAIAASAMALVFGLGLGLRIFVDSWLWWCVAAMLLPWASLAASWIVLAILARHLGRIRGVTAFVIAHAALVLTMAPYGVRPSVRSLGVIMPVVFAVAPMGAAVLAAAWWPRRAGSRPQVD